jgi:hypothetical protein
MKLSSLVSSQVTWVSALLMAAAAPAAFAQVSAATSPYGVMSVSLPKGSRGIAAPLPAQNLFVGLTTVNTASAISLTESSGDPRTALAGAGACYVEILTGGLEGERFDVDLDATATGSGAIVLKLGAGTHSTLTALGVGALAQAQIIVRPHLTLARLQAAISPALVGSNSPGTADGVQIFDGADWARYHLRADGATWVKTGESGDVRHLVIPPDVSVVMDLKSGAKTWLHQGVVRTNVFRKNLVVGPQAFATGFPLALSPTQVGGFVDVQTPAGFRWTGADDFEAADSFEKQAAGGAMAANRYFLRSNGTAWRLINNATNIANEPILGATDAFLLRRKKPDPAYAVEVPFGR